MVKNPPSNAGDAGSIPGQGTKIPHAAGQLSPRATTIELGCLNERACMLQTTEPMCAGARTPQLERENLHTTPREKPEPTASHNEKILRASTKIPCATKTQCSQRKKKKGEKV